MNDPGGPRRSGKLVGVYDRPASADRARNLRRLAPWLIAAIVLLGVLIALLTLT